MGHAQAPGAPGADPHEKCCEQWSLDSGENVQLRKMKRPLHQICCVWRERLEVNDENVSWGEKKKKHTTIIYWEQNDTTNLLYYIITE